MPWIASSGPCRPEDGCGRPSQPRICTQGLGTPLEPDNLRRSWYPLRKRLGLEIRFHDLRHSAVSLLLDLGVPPHIVRQTVGHSDIGVTMKVYAHASLDEQRKALRKLGDTLT
ncbi:tyrosine-type recombinase/integrase [Streptomyces sp. NPDC093984]|uniref:tyrosine-type recombinase/integrase n=1 Tax=Streptomyces sp. NPDC093984 TaxID=3366052 RepID=UPI0037F454D1